MEDIWNITALVVSVLSVLLSLYALRQATTKNTSDMYLSLSHNTRRRI